MRCARRALPTPSASTRTATTRWVRMGDLGHPTAHGPLGLHACAMRRMHGLMLPHAPCGTCMGCMLLHAGAQLMAHASRSLPPAVQARRGVAAAEDPQRLQDGGAHACKPAYVLHAVLRMRMGACGNMHGPSVAAATPCNRMGAQSAACSTHMRCCTPPKATTTCPCAARSSSARTRSSRRRPRS